MDFHLIFDEKILLFLLLSEIIILGRPLYYKIIIYLRLSVTPRKSKHQRSLLDFDTKSLDYGTKSLEYGTKSRFHREFVLSWNKRLLPFASKLRPRE
jgi:hypothetical protein